VQSSPRHCALLVIEATIRIPATTANLGPGFDCLGIALQLANRVTVRARSDLQKTTHPGMVRDAASRFFSASRKAPFAFDWSIAGEVPRSRGMGSSVTVRLGLLHGLNQLSGMPLDATNLFQICADLEGHPDNAAPAAFGGIAVSKPGVKPLIFPVDEALHFVLLIPDFEVSTPEARKVLPETLDRRRAVESVVNACRITAAFASRDYEALRGAFGDHLHQPHREPLIPFLTEVISAGESAGAIGGWLSGSGSTICCLTTKEPEAVAAAMLAASHSPGARSVITHADNRGTTPVGA
jgi:homoserine kinase